MQPVPINEIFYTLQGEARFTGTPAIFIRTQGCPVGCSFCDTKYSWFLEESNEVDQEDILNDNHELEHWANVDPERMLEWCQNNAPACKHIVLTGGEPYVHDLADFTKLFCDAGYTVQLETSATHSFNGDPRCWHTVSPKVGMTGGYTVINDCLEQADEIKHPVGKQKDLDNLLHLLSNSKLKDGVKIWLQPLSQSAKATAFCVDTCQTYGFNLSIQTHKYAGVR